MNSSTPHLRTAYNLIIIGAGSGGVVAALFAAKTGARVALIERHRIGGDCTWTGCVPSKALIKAARVAHAAKTARDFGIAMRHDERQDLGAVMTYVRGAVQTVYATETPDALRARGVDVHLAHARFASAHAIELLGPDGQPTGSLSGKHFIVCTGARATLPPLAGLANVQHYTNETIFDLDILPRHLLILGGGPVGCEMAQAFRRLGSQVTIVQAGDRLLPRDEPEASAALLNLFQNDGIAVLLNTRIDAARQEGGQVVLEHGEKQIAGDALLVAVGRTPNVGALELQKAGVRYTDKGIPVDSRLRTNIKHIYAAGDVTGGPQFTHLASYQAFVAARNALYPGSNCGLVATPPWATFTSPEIARAGYSEAEARKIFGADVSVRTMPMRAVDRAIAEGDTAGFIKVVLAKKGVVVGATIMAERAGEAIQEWALAIHHKWPLDKIRRKHSCLPDVCHREPTTRVRRCD